MKSRFRLYRRSQSGRFYIQDNVTGKQESLGTSERPVALKLFHARNEAVRQPELNIQLARAYLAGNDPEALSRNWQFAIDELTRLKKYLPRTGDVARAAKRVICLVKPSSVTPLNPAAACDPVASQAGKEQIGVAIVDDDENVQLFIKDVLDQTPGFSCVGCYSSGEAALTGIAGSGAKLVLMDIRLPGMSGIACTRRLKALLPSLFIVMVSGLDDVQTMNHALEAGGDSYLTKPFSVGQLLATLLSCRSRMSASVGVARLGNKNVPARASTLRYRTLTARENRLMEYMAEGLLYKEIASELGVSFSKVHKMQNKIFHKLGATNRTEAIRKWQSGERGSTRV